MALNANHSQTAALDANNEQVKRVDKDQEVTNRQQKWRDYVYRWRLRPGGNILKVKASHTIPRGATLMVNARGGGIATRTETEDYSPP